jgi:hypothetical protein
VLLASRYIVWKHVFNMYAVSHILLTKPLFNFCHLQLCNYELLIPFYYCENLIFSSSSCFTSSTSKVTIIFGLSPFFLLDNACYNDYYDFIGGSAYAMMLSCTFFCSLFFFFFFCLKCLTGQ